MAIVNGYCTLPELRTWMSDTGSILPTELLENAITATSRMIERYTGRKFWKDAIPNVRRYRVTETDIAWVDDIASTTDLVVKTDDLADGTFATTWSSTDYDLSPFNADVETDVPYAFHRIHAVERLFPVNYYRRTLEVTAQFGWSSVPEQVKQACLMKSNILVLRKDSPYGIAGFSEFGVVRINRTEDPEITRLLAPFVRSNVRAV